MSPAFLASILGGGIGEAVKAVGQVADDLFTSDEEKELAKTSQYKAETDRIHTEQADRIAQIKVNQEEAKHRSVFVSGWRPFVGWVAGVGFGIHVILIPIVSLALSFFAPDFKIPEFQTGLILTILGGILGIGKTLRTVEKAKGVARHK